MQISKKIVLIGHFGVGKTSLVKRFVQEKFSEEYHTSIGVKVDKKVVVLGDAKVSLLIWDIAGEASLESIPDSYLLGAHGSIYVFDYSREVTYENISDQISIIKNKLLNVPLVIVGNKSDLIDEYVREQILAEISLAGIISTSAKLGEGVESLFEDLARKLIS